MAMLTTGYLYDYWWHPLLAIPLSPGTLEYERLHRLWWDQTRVRKVGGRNTPEFYNSAWETHLTAVLWENFAFLPTDIWISLLAKQAGLKRLSNSIQHAQWSYGWETVGDTHRGIKILDVVLHYRDTRGSEGVLVVEAKRPGAKIAHEKDLDPQYYLDVVRLRDFKQQRSLVYLVSAKKLATAQASVKRGTWDVGFLSWEILAGVQIQSALAATDCPEKMRLVVAAAIHRQFLSYGITPSQPPLDYLKSEQPWQEIQKQWKTAKQTIADRRKELFRLPAAQ